MKRRAAVTRWACLLSMTLAACNCAGPTGGAAGEPLPPHAGAPASSSRADGADAAKDEETDKRIRLLFDDQVLTATLEDTAAARDFLALLPLDLTLRDYAGKEKVSDLPSRLSTEGVPAGVDPDVGDLTYYAPWGNLAIFYRDFGYANGLVRIGRIDSGVEQLAQQRGEFAVRFERASRRNRP